MRSVMKISSNNPLCILGICFVIISLDRVIHSETGSNTVRKLSVLVEIIHCIFQMHNESVTVIGNTN